ncbi:hypothetical protein B0H19DRAFT_1238672 [Mycena capillaripes]|nr:hypothetical protein B0H19DRAFT_1238672 [Mycena capillaripes]
MSSVLSAGLIQAFLELTLYGVYFVIFSTVVYLFWHRPALTRPRIFVFLALVTQFLVITAHWINTIYGTYLPFVQLGGGAEAENFYHTLGTPSLKTHIVLTETTNTLTDCLVIHRLYVIWDFKFSIVAFPLVLLVLQVVSGSGSIYGFFTQSQASFHAWSIGWITTNLVASLVLSRILQPFAYPLSGRHRLISILVIMIESAALQTAMNLALLLAFHIGGAVEPNFILKGVQAVVLGMSSVLIYARIGLGWTQENPSASSGTTNPSSISFTLNVARNRDAEQIDLGDCSRDISETELARK